MDRKANGRTIGLQVKGVLVLTFIVLIAISSGGWLYYMVTARMLRANDVHEAERLARALAVAAAPNMVGGKLQAVRKLTVAALDHPNVHHVCVVDRRGGVIMTAGGRGPDIPAVGLASERPTLSYDIQRGENFLEMGRPIIAPGRTGQARLVGGVRMLVDTRATARILAGVQEEMGLSAALVLVCAIPLGLLLVWRVVGLPVGRLVRATRRLSEGDFSARVETHRNDEIGELACSFNTMAERLNASQQQLRLANESLERKVAERTGELERANRRLRHEMDEKEDFLRAVSHDLSAPLRNIAGMATMISMKYAPALPEEVQTRLERIQANVASETDLIAELLELSRIRTRPQRRQRVDFGELLNELAGSFEYELKQKQIELIVHQPMPVLHVARNRMRQVLQNLVDNAIKYMDRATGGRIEVRHEEREGMHRFSVSDNGPGIRPEEQDRIFYIFGRAASARSANLPGRGVGLASVRSIAQTYDGWAWVESAEGAGSTFHVTLDAKRTAAPGEEEAAAPAAAGAEAG